MLTVLLVAASITIFAVCGYAYQGNRACRRRAMQRCLVRQEERLAEARMQRVMQDTVERMFEAVRRRQ